MLALVATASVVFGPALTMARTYYPATCCNMWNQGCYDMEGSPDNVNAPCNNSACQAACDANGALSDACRDCCRDVIDDWDCPIDCRITEWISWSPCQDWPDYDAPSSCDGQMRRMRTLIFEAKRGGIPCGDTMEAQSCRKDTPECSLKWGEAAFRDWCAESGDRCTNTCQGRAFFSNHLLANVNPECVFKERKAFRCKNYRGQGICGNLPGCKEVKKTHRGGREKTRCKGKIQFE